MIFFKKSPRRKWLFRGLTLVLAAFVILFGIDFAVGVFSPRHQQAQPDINYYYNVVGGESRIALTFDDGPGPVRTPQIMEVLQRQQVPATFFFLGTNALRYPEIVKEAYSAGFEIGNHTFTHSPHVHQTEKRLELELNTTNKIIESITGQPTLLYRPPFLLDIGEDPVPDPKTMSDPLVWALANGYIPVGADIDSHDWRSTSADDVVANFLGELGHGHIALFHDGPSGPYTPEALEAIIVELKARGYEFTTASDAIGLHLSEQVKLTRDLKYGMIDRNDGNEISVLQMFLLKEGDFSYQTTGYFGPITRAALSDWQARSGLTDERGFVGPLTREAIALSLAQTTPTPQPTRDVLSHSPFGGYLQQIYIFASSAVGKFVVVLVTVLFLLVTLRLLLMLGLFAYSFRRVTSPRVLTKDRASVIVPAYNEEENIAATLESIIRNGDAVREIIVVNDGSTDRTGLVVRSVQGRNPEAPIKLIEIANGGKARALNLGIKQAASDIVVTTDGDSLFDDKAISHLIRNFADPKVGAVAGKVRVANSGGVLSAFQHLEYLIGQNIDKRALASVQAVAVVPGPIGAWRVSALRAVGSYSGDTLVEDQDLTHALLAAGKRVVYEPAAVAYTEVPHTVRDLIKQRFRWTFGTLQCLWKYKSHLFSLRARSLGWVVLPHNLVFGIFLPLIYPFMDVLFVVALIVGFQPWILLAYLVFLVIDLMYAGVALLSEKHQRRYLWLVPVQRIFYRFIVFFVVLRSVVKAIEGTGTLWSKIRKRGAARHLYLELRSHSPRAFT